jgi:ABC-type transporter Mla subunit MlaD
MHRSRIQSLLAVLLLAGLASAAPASAQTLLDQARDAVRDAGKSIEDAARQAGRDATDFLAENPDLNRDIIDLGRRMGLPGFDDAPPYLGADLAVAPPTAAPGSAVVLRAVGLPGKARVVAAFGPPRGEQPTIATGITDERGAIALDAAVPVAARPGDSGVFVIETENGRVRLVSETFTVASPGPAPGTRVEVEGTLSSEGVECPALRGDDGRLYALTDPDAGGFGPGDRVRVAGEVAGMSICMQGIPLTGTRITAAGQ